MNDLYGSDEFNKGGLITWALPDTVLVDRLQDGLFAVRGGFLVQVLKAFSGRHALLGTLLGHVKFPSKRHGPFIRIVDKQHGIAVVTLKKDSRVSGRDGLLMVKTKSEGPYSCHQAVLGDEGHAQKRQGFWSQAGATGIKMWSVKHCLHLFVKRKRGVHLWILTQTSSHPLPQPQCCHGWPMPHGSHCPRNRRRAPILTFR